MASIHDVAKLANVSTATVSKHLNGTGYVSPDKRDAINQAVATLGYSINRNARMLKTKQSQDILFIVPNMLERIYREIAESTTAVLGEDYRVIIQLTHDKPERERKILQECMGNSCAGILLVTCIPSDGELLQKVQDKIPTVFLYREPQKLTSYSYFGFNHFDTVYGLASEMYRLGYEDIGLFVGDAQFSSEQECIRGFGAMLQNYGIGAPSNRIFSAPIHKEITFRKVMRLFDSGDYPQVFICSSTVTAQAISDVAYFRHLEIGRDLFIFTLGEDSWYNSIFVNRIISTYRDARKVGALAAASVKERIQSPLIYEPLHVKLNDEFAFHWIERFIRRLAKNIPIRPEYRPVCKLKIAYNNGDAGTDVLRSLLPQYMHQFHTDVELVSMNHDDLFQHIDQIASSKSGEYDLFSVDAPWVPFFQSKGVLEDLTERLGETDIGSNLAPRVLENIGTYQGHVYGVPHTYSLQMLFYRRDLFENPEIAEQFYRQYQVKLEPPKTWNMFNIISSFFTKSKNPDSPTVYGTSLFGGGNGPSICTELYPKIWSYNGTVFDKSGHVRLYTHENRKAYQSLLDSITDSPPETLDDDAFQGMQRLLEGETAMCISFSNNACYFLESYSNFFQHSIGFVPIPDSKPIVSGWNTCINPYGQHKEEAWNFIRWLASLEIASTYTLMGGAAPMTSLLKQESLVQMYPWNTMAFGNYHTGVRREIPAISNTKHLNPVEIDNILASVIYDCLGEGASLETALFRAHRQLCKYAEANGYPKNMTPIQKTLHVRR